MTRRIEILEESTVTRRVTRIYETSAGADPPWECIECGAPTLWDADGEYRKCVDCGDVREAIEHQLPLALTAGRRG